MRDFRLYMLVGGMPQAVDKYIKTNDLSAVDTVKRDIIALYEEDLRKIDTSGKSNRYVRRHTFTTEQECLTIYYLDCHPWRKARQDNRHCPTDGRIQSGKHSLPLQRPQC